MDDINKNFQDEWRKAFKDAEEEPSPLLWQSLENKLAEKELKIFKRKYFYLRMAAAILLFLFSTTSLYYIYHFTQEDTFAGHKNQSIEKESTDKILIAKDSEKYSDSSNGIVEGQSKDYTTILADNDRIEPPFGEKETASENQRKFSKEISKNRTSTDYEALDNKDSEDLISNNIENESTITDKQTLDSQLGESSIIIAKDRVVDNKKTGNNGFENDIILPITVDNNIAQNEHNTVNNTPVTTPANSVAMIQPLVGKEGDFNPIQLKKFYPFKRQITKEPIYYASNSEKKSKNKRWYTSYGYTPTYTNQNFENTSSAQPFSLTSDPNFSLSRNAQVEKTMKNSAEELEMAITPQYSWNTGVNGGYKLTEKLVVEMGVNYAYTESKVKTNHFVRDPQTNNQYPAFNAILKEYPSEEKTVGAFSTPFEDIAQNGGSPRPGSSKNMDQNYKSAEIYTQYIGIPLTLSYKLIDKKVNVLVGGGVSTDFFVEYGSKKNESDGFGKETVKSNETTTFNPIGFSFLINPEIEYEVSSRYSFYLRPVYKGALSSYTDTKKISSKPNSTGLGFGLRYNFN